MFRTAIAIAFFSLFAVTQAARAADEKKKAQPSPAPPGKSAPAAAPKARDAQTAMKEFRTEIAAILARGEKTINEAPEGNRAAGMRVMKTSTASLAAVRTDGLPDDLRTAYDRMAKFWKAMSEFYDDMPDDDSAVQAWAKKKFSDPEVEAKFKPAFAEGKAGAGDLNKMSQKYGIEFELPGKQGSPRNGARITPNAKP